MSWRRYKMRKMMKYVGIYDTKKLQLQNFILENLATWRKISKLQKTHLSNSLQNFHISDFSLITLHLGGYRRVEKSNFFKVEEMKKS